MSGAVRRRTLLIAEAANPQWASVPLIGWSLSQALSRVTEAHLVTQVRNRGALLEAGLEEGVHFTAIDSERIGRPLWRLSNLLRRDRGRAWTVATATAALSYYYFEYLVWRRFGRRIRDRRFDLVHRITPLSPTIPSMLASRCRSAGVPFVLGPLNGGVPWPKGFDAVRRQESEWLSYVRGAYRLLPGYASTLRDSSAIIVGSRDTLMQIPARRHEKCVYLPENAVDPNRFQATAAPAVAGRPLRACFVGRLVPYKGADMLLEAVAPFLKAGSLVLDIVGDGPALAQLRALSQRLGLGEAVDFHGWVQHARVQELMRMSQLFLFPSVREFGGAVVLEAMSIGVVPVVVNYGGPGELVTPESGFRVPVDSRACIVAGFRDTVGRVLAAPGVLAAMSSAARERVARHFTWEAKAAQILKVYEWVLAPGLPRPAFRLGGPERAG